MEHFSKRHIEEARAKFRDYLRDGGQRQTPERFAVLDELYRTGEHLDADAIHLRLREQGVSVSRATVYNTLELLVACNLVARHQFGQAQARYERAYSYWQHDHLICLDCNELFEFCDPRLHGIQEMIGEIYGFRVSQHSLNLYGHCGREACPNRPGVKESVPS